MCSLRWISTITPIQGLCRLKDPNCAPLAILPVLYFVCLCLVSLRMSYGVVCYGVAFTTIVNCETQSLGMVPRGTTCWSIRVRAKLKVSLLHEKRP